MNFQHFLTVFKYELRRNFLRKGFLFTTFVLPIILLGVGMILQRVATQPLTDPEQSTSMMNELTDQFTPDLTATYGLVDHSGIVTETARNQLVMYATEAEAGEALEAGQLTGYYIIPADYIETGDATLVLPEFVIGDINEGLLEDVLISSMLDGVPLSTMTRLVNPMRLSEFNLSITNAQTGDASADEDSLMIVVYLFAMILIMSVFMTNGYLVQSVIEEKETRFIEILLSSVRPIELLSGKILALGILGITQMALWLVIAYVGLNLLSGGATSQIVGAAPMLTNINFPVESLPVIFLYFILAYLMFAAVYAAIGAISNSAKEGPQYAVFLTLPALAPLYVTPLFVSQPNGPVAIGLSLFPITAPIAMIQRLAISTVPLEQVILSLVILIITVIVLMWVAARIFRVGTLLSGQMPKLRDLPKLIRS